MSAVKVNLFYLKREKNPSFYRCLFSDYSPLLLSFPFFLVSSKPTTTLLSRGSHLYQSIPRGNKSLMSPSKTTVKPTH